jgi:DNA-binding phage protein
MTKAFGGVQSVAEKANLNSTQLYRTLSEEGNPALSSLAAILKAMGLRLAVERVKAA